MIRFFGRPRVMAGAVMVIAAMAGIAIFLGSIALIRLGSQTDRVTTLVDNIQVERVRNIRTNCEQQNMRHDLTIATLDRLLQRREATTTPAERAQIKQSRDATVLLIEALAPKRDCAQVVRDQTGKSTSS